MRASDARKAVELNKEFQEIERNIIQEGENNIKSAISNGRMSCLSGLHFNNENHWGSIISHWEGLGYTVVWNLGGGQFPSRYPNMLEW